MQKGVQERSSAKCATAKARAEADELGRLGLTADPNEVKPKAPRLPDTPTPEERAQTGHWWKRKETDMYFGPVSLRDR